jgi:hypothetical protein
MTIECPCCEYRWNPQAKRPRSVPQHKRLFALIRAAHFHWPETTSMQFTSVKNFRKWLTMKAGWRDIASETDVHGMPDNIVLVIAKAAFAAAKSYAVPVVHKGRLIIWVPRSIAFDKMDHEEACKLCDAVAVVIEQETGLRPEELLTEKAA